MELLVLFGLILANGVFAGAEIAVVALRRSRMEELAAEGRRGARAVLALQDDPERFLATVQVGITVIGATAGAFGGASVAAELAPALERVPWVGARAHSVAVALVIAGISYFSIVLGELVPKSLALRGAERYALVVARPLRTLSWLARPLVWLLSASANVVLRPFGDRTTFIETRHSVEELQQLVEDATKTGDVPPEAADIASRALELPELTAADVMVPRQQVTMIDRSASAADLEKVLLEHPHSRLPVCDGGPDDVVGYLAIKDVLACALKRQRIAVESLVRPATFVPETMKALALLEELRKRRTPFAIVVDEAGGTAGIVTIEDVVEELVGDYFSEHVALPPALVEREGEHVAVVSGGAPVRDVNRALEIELPEDGDWTTVAGLVLALAGRVPLVGDVVVVPDGPTLEVVDATPRRVRSVRVRFEPEPAQAEDPAAG